jgi:sulfopyruvate decarboxylase subunit beta
MRRYEALIEIMKAITNEPVICNLGHPAQELFSVQDRPRNFYMLGSMGLATSIGHGLALCRRGKVVVIDGDASVTMNLGGFATIGYTRPKNLVQIIIDNSANGSTGFQPSFTAAGLQLDQIARASGIAEVSKLTVREEIIPAVVGALKSEQGPSLIVVKTDIGMPQGISTIPIGGLEIKDRFMRSLNQETPDFRGVEVGQREDSSTF